MQDQHDTPRVLLASRSPRRRSLLAAAGIPYECIGAAIDDSGLDPGSVPVAEWAAALAYLKAAAALAAQPNHQYAPGRAVVLGADTIVAKDDLFLGQPADSGDARRVLDLLNNAEHDVVTGVAFIDPATGDRELFSDIAHVTVGAIPPHALDAYIASEQWRGKAGAYNLAERLDAGWPITFRGDPGTIMGLPTAGLADRLRRFAARVRRKTPAHPAGSPQITTPKPAAVSGTPPFLG